MSKVPKLLAGPLFLKVQRFRSSLKFSVIFLHAILKKLFKKQRQQNHACFENNEILIVLHMLFQRKTSPGLFRKLSQKLVFYQLQHEIHGNKKSLTIFSFTMSKF